MSEPGRGVDLRPLGAGDLGAVLSLNEHWVPHVGSIDSRGLQKLLGLSTLALGAWLAPGGEDDLAGFVMVLSAGADYASPNYRYFAQRHERFTYVDRIAVAPSAQGRGVGTALYDEVVSHARAAGSPVVCAEVNLEPPNPDSQAFHGAYGFTEVGRQWTYGDSVEVRLLELAL